MTEARSVVLFGVGSPLAVDVEESCRRLRIAIAGAVKNVAGPHYLLDASVVRDLASLDAALLRIPCIVPLFTPFNRDKATREAKTLGFAIASALIDPTAILASSTSIGTGSYVNAGAVIGAATRIGEDVVVNRSCSIGHHVQIQSMVSIGPAAVLAGEVRIGRGSIVGAGAIILPRIKIGGGCVIGAGAVVTKDIPAGSLVLGSPARIVQDGLPLLDACGSAPREDHD
jgi:sugar O-acyltransferase (sialic acid O-acetyltransferase NeuD family)